MRKKILQITYSLNIGGLEKLVFDLATHLNAEKYDVSVAVLSTQTGLKPDFEKAGIPVHVLPKKKGIDYTLPFRLKKLFLDNKIDIIHTHNIAPWLYAGIAKKMAGTKTLIHTEHSNIFSDKKRLMAAEKVLSSFTDVIICDSANVGSYLIHKQNIPDKKVKVILNGIDTDKFKPAKKNGSGSAAGGGRREFIIGTVSRLEPVKDHITLLDAMRIITADFPETKLVIAGDGSMMGALKNAVKQMGLEKNVVFLGAVNNVPEVLAGLDLFVLTSISEGLPLCICEAMSMELPVVATDVGGVGEIIINKKTGYLAEPKNPKDIANAVLKLRRNPADMKTFGETGRKRVEALFSLKKMVKNYEEVYESTYSNKPLA